jgi:hypothetical protein
MSSSKGVVVDPQGLTVLAGCCITDKHRGENKSLCGHKIWPSTATGAGYA